MPSPPSSVPGRPPSGAPPAEGPEAEIWAREAAAAAGVELLREGLGDCGEGSWTTSSTGRSAVTFEERGGSHLNLVMTDPFDADFLDAVAWARERSVRPLVTTRSKLDSLVVGRGGNLVASRPNTGIGGGVEDAAAIRQVDALLLEAARRRASDLHLEPLPGRLRVRLRIDGELVEAAGPPGRLKGPIVSRVKLLAGLNLDERRIPQDGRVRVRLDGRDLDLRVSSLPALHGESLVLRLLEPEAPRRGLGELGLEPEDEAGVRRLLAAGDGLVFVAGPTGAGKTTSLYACLQALNTPERKILTVEDPVEYRLPGVNQVPVRAETGVTFASALRAFLRQAPHVIMIGEVRDAETAALALQAALTGHLVLSTLHTGDAPSGVARLLDLGASPALVAAGLRGTVAQRLVRRVCPACTRPAPPTARELVLLGVEADSAAARSICRGAGCGDCGGTGYRGRLGIFEVLAFDEGLRGLIARRAGHAELRSAATAAGWRPLAVAARRKVLAGVTTIEEFLAVTTGR